MWYNKYGEIMEKIINFKDNINKEEMFEVAEAINKGKIVVFPTETDRKSTRLNSSHYQQSRMPSSA